MIISYHGIEFVKVQFGNTVLAFNPVSKQSKHKLARFGADIGGVGLNHDDMNGVESVTLGDKKPFVIGGPGEYEIGGVTVVGLPTLSRYGSQERINTVYSVTMEGMSLCFLGAHEPKDLPKEVMENLDNIDILFVPVGGEGVLTPQDAYRLAVSIEPRLIIPIHYGEVGMSKALSVFLKEAGEESVKAIDKLTIKKKDLEGKEGDIVVLDNPLG